MKNQLFTLLAVAFSLGLAAQPAAPKPGNYALFFAVEEYQNALIKGPQGALQDARSIAAVLASSYGVQVEVVENPTAQQIRDKLATYREQLAQGQLPKNGQLLIYFIGQGASEGVGGSFFPADALVGRPDTSGYSWGRWLKEVAQLNCQKILVVADAAFSNIIEQDWISDGRPLSRYLFQSASDGRYSPEGHPGRSWTMLAMDPREYRGASGRSLSQYFLKNLAWLAEQQAPVDLINLRRAMKEPQWASTIFFNKGGYGSNFQLAFTAAEHTPSAKEGKANRYWNTSGYKKNEGADEALWQLVQQENTLLALSFYCQAYPKGRYIEEARARMYTFPDSLKTADGRVWLPRPLPQKGADGFVLARIEAASSRGYGGTSPRGTPPAVTRTLRDFYLSPGEVTNADFDQFCLETGVFQDARADLSKPDHPLVNVTWYEAVEYCNWLSRERGLEPVYDISKERKDPNNHNRSDTLKWTVTARRWANGYRLPTAAEWEYAYGQQDRSASYGEFGLYNMGEKVLEWCWNWDYPYVPEAAAAYGPEAGAFRALRGYSKDDVSYRRTYAERFSEIPGRHRSDVGFRLVRNGW